jgi:Eco29kI restriction endonuclease
MIKVFNPLDKFSLAKSIELELLRAELLRLDGASVLQGAGIYAIYYSGPFAAYAPVRIEANLETNLQPIYIGKAIPKGGRKGGLTKDASTGRALADRLAQHASSVNEAANLELGDFWIRHLVVDDVWIPLGENMLIESFKPVWNRAIDGFGNKDPGRRRSSQYRSPWDVLHPGRAFAVKLGESPVSVEFLLKRVSDYFAGRKMVPLPKKLAEQIANENAEAEEGADKV